MAKVKISVTISDTLLAQVRRLSPNVSDIVERAVSEYTTRALNEQALARSRGGWSDDAHPELESAADVAGYVRALRSGWNRPNV